MQRDTNQQFGTHAERCVNDFHTDVVKEVKDAIANNDVVVVGMALNSVVKKVRTALEAKEIEYVYLEYGGYFSKWKERLAIKLWSGWPTYPQVFVKGTLMGGNEMTRKALEDGSLQAMLKESSND